MNQDFVLGKLTLIMGWDTDRSTAEIAWLSLMARMKYDGYQDFRAGVRFVESLADWLQQFPLPQERQAAYDFVRNHLVYVSPAEMNHLVELFYPVTVQWRLMEEAARLHSIPRYRVWAHPAATARYARLLRQTLFIELSDGARIDVFRRSNAGLISNEQVVTAPRITRAKWDDLLKDLREDKTINDPTARFAFVFLVDDFIGSGTTLLRRGKDGRGWNGKLYRFWKDLEDEDVLESHFDPDWTLCVHHYLATHNATTTAADRQTEALAERKREGEGWFDRVRFSYGMVLPSNLPIDQAGHSAFFELIQNYYDDSIEDKHMKVGGDDARLGFGKCALPLVLEHNTPNNSVALLWADTVGTKGQHAMRPLFRRRQRHS